MMKVRIQDSRVAEGYRIADLNRRKAITERCLNCSGFSYVERKKCEHTDCQLWLYRLGIGKCESKARNSAIRTYCRDFCTEGGGYAVSRCPSTNCPLFPYRMTKVDRTMEVL